MRHDDQRAGEIEQEILQPVDRFDVEVVGGLVEQEDVRLAEERLREQDLDLVAAL